MSHTHIKHLYSCLLIISILLFSHSLNAQTPNENLVSALDNLEEYDERETNALMNKLYEQNNLTVSRMAKLFMHLHDITKEYNEAFYFSETVQVKEGEYFIPFLEYLKDHIEEFPVEELKQINWRFFLDNLDYISEDNCYQMKVVTRAIQEIGVIDIVGLIEERCEQLEKANADYMNNFMDNLTKTLEDRLDPSRNKYLENANMATYKNYYEIVSSYVGTLFDKSSYEVAYSILHNFLSDIRNQKVSNIDQTIELYGWYCSLRTLSNGTNEHFSLNTFINEIAIIIDPDSADKINSELMNALASCSGSSPDEHEYLLLASFKEDEDNLARLPMNITSYVLEEDYTKAFDLFKKGLSRSGKELGNDSEEFLSILSLWQLFMLDEFRDDLVELYKEYGDQMIDIGDLSEVDFSDPEVKDQLLMINMWYNFFDDQEMLESLRNASGMKGSEKFISDQMLQIDDGWTTEKSNISLFNRYDEIIENSQYSNDYIDALANIFEEITAEIDLSSNQDQGILQAKVEENIQQIINVVARRLSYNDHNAGEGLILLSQYRKNVAKYLLDLRKAILRGEMGRKKQEILNGIVEIQREIHGFNYLSKDQRVAQSDNYWTLLSSLDDREDLVLSKGEISKFPTPPIYSVNDLRSSLNNDGAAIEIIRYIEGDKGYWTENVKYLAICLTKDSQYPEVIPISLGRYSESEILQLYVESLEGDKVASRLLHQMLLEPILLSLNRASNIIMSPEGIYSMINFHTISSELGLSENHKYRSVRSLAAIMKKNIISHTYSDALLIAAPEFNLVEPDNESNATLEIWNELRGSSKEYWQIHGILNEAQIDVNGYTGKNATVRQIEFVNSSHFDICHISTHGFSNSTGSIIELISDFEVEFDSTSFPFHLNNRIDSSKEKSLIPAPKTSFQQIMDTIDGGDDIGDMLDDIGVEFFKYMPHYGSGLVMAGANSYWSRSQLNKGILYSSDIIMLDFDDVKVVGLSACNTFGNQIGLNGLPDGIATSFLISGAHNVVGTLWQVGDEVASDFFTSFYNYLLLGKESIHDAFDKAIVVTRSKYPNPYMWGSFVLLENDL